MSRGSYGLRRTLRGLLAAAALFSGAARAEDPLQWEMRLTPALVKPKAKVRDGKPTLAPSDLHSGPDLNVDEAVPGFGGEIAMRLEGHPLPFELFHVDDDEVPVEDAFAVPAHRLSLGFWWTATDGDGELQEAKNVGGATYAEGTPVDSRLEWTSLRLQYLYTIPIHRERLKADVGLALDRTTFKSEMDFPSGEANMSLWGIYPSPQVALEARLVDEISVRLGIGGFKLLRIPNGDTEISQHVEYRAALVGRWKCFAFEAGYHLFHLHLEENPHDPEQDTVHTRLRSLYFSVAAEF